MRPLYHPALEEITVEGILYALSDPVRVSIYAELAGQSCTHNCSNFLTVSNQAIPKSTLSQHFKILRENGLVHAERHGVELRLTTRCQELEPRYPGLIRTILNAHALQSARAMKSPRTKSRDRAPRSR